MIYPIQISCQSKRGKEQGQLCTSCYLGWGIIWNGDTFKVDKCLFCN